MAGQKVEREHCARPMPSVPPAGGSAHMPPHSQEAERRPERRARRTRWGLRTLVIGGLAGAAWLLTGAAAHAADRTDGSTGPLPGSVAGDDSLPPVVTSPVSALLATAARPLEHEPSDVDTVLDVPNRLLSQPDDGVGEDLPVVHDEARKQPATSRRAEPNGKQRGAAATPVRREHGHAYGHRRARRAAVRTAHRHRIVHRSATPHRSEAAHVASPQAVPYEVPGGGGPAGPEQPHVWDVSGTPTAGSGNPLEGGASALLPAGIAHRTTAGHRLPIVHEVETLSHVAEEPTVSPD